jgi:hypothetical protein
VIVFWKGDKVRTVSKVADRKFTRTYAPPESFLVLDELGFHLYRDFVHAWRATGDGAQDVLGIGDGKFAQVTVTGAGTAQVTRKDKARVVDVIAVEADGQRTLVYADEKDELWGIIAPGLTLNRGGWALGEVQAPVATPDPAVGDPSGPNVGAEAPPTGEPDIGAEAPPTGEPDIGAEAPPTADDEKPKPLPID